MTYCLGMRINKGLILLADTCISSGAHRTYAKKIYTYTNTRKNLFIATSGLRSVRDKTITYFDQLLHREDHDLSQMYQVVNAFGKCLRKVAEEDKEILKDAGYKFDTHALIGGQFIDDPTPELYLLFPEGNWVRVNEHSECFSGIGSVDTAQGLLKMLLSREKSVDYALRTGLLAFDLTVRNIATVAYPCDVLIYLNDSHQFQSFRLEEEDVTSFVKLIKQHLSDQLEDHSNSFWDLTNNQ
ncbi:MAG: peptidase [Saprospiraceae bacterium]|nr:peptidase [Saprospiraceae bacterium]